jgi:hypothetical protein
MEKNQKLIDENVNLNQLNIKMNQSIKAFDEEVSPFF